MNSMDAALLGIVFVPLVAIAGSLVLPAVHAGRVSIVVALVEAVPVCWLLVGCAHGRVARLGLLRADALSVVFLAATAFLYVTVMVYAAGYLHQEGPRPGSRRYARLFYAGMNVFAWAMLCAPVMNGLALLWVAIEVTTIVSALLVAIDDTDGATEAAWKYVLLASTGLGIALLGTIFMYYAGAQVLGRGYDLAFGPLLSHAQQLPATPVRLAFVLAVVGFGTKVGLVPMHTWLPDAHAEAPTPVSVLLSGALLAVSFYAVLRYHEIAERTLGPTFSQRVLLVFGLASLLLAALYLLRQRDVKRLLAYSSVEHMGIIAIGVSFGSPLAAAGVLLHVLAHAAGKGGAFMGSGALMRAFGTKDLARIRDAVTVLPWTAPIFLGLVLGLCGLPPAGLFRSELEIVAGGFGSHHNAGTAALLVLVVVAFVGLIGAATTSVLSPRTDHPGHLGQAGHSGRVGHSGHAPRHRGAPVTMVVAMGLCLAALTLLGVHPPGTLTSLLSTAATQLTGGA